MHHLDPIRAGLAQRVPVPGRAGRTGRRLLPRRRQDHRLVVDGMPMRVGDAERVPEAALLAVVRRVLAALALGQRVCRVALGVAAGTDVPAGAARSPAEQGVDHWGVADDHGDERLATGPAAGLGRTVCAGLCCQPTEIRVLPEGDSL
jgi:hypothetical protein